MGQSQAPVEARVLTHPKEFTRILTGMISDSQYL